MNYLKRYGLGDYFNNVVTLVPKVLKTGLPVAIALFIPAATFYFLGFRSLGSNFSQIAEVYGDNRELIPLILKMVGGFLWFLPGGIFIAVGHHLLNAMVGKKAFSVIHGEETPSQALRSAINGPFWPLVLQGIVMGAIIGLYCIVLIGVVVVLLLLTTIPGASLYSEGISSNPGVIIAIVVAYLLLFVGVYWFMIKTLVAPQALIREGVGPFAGIKRSFTLTKGNFWRSLGIYILVTMVMNFAISLVTGPVFFVMVLPGYIEFIKSIFASGDSSGSSQALESFTLIKTLAPGVGISMAIQSIFYYILQPIFGSLLYTDLAIRKGEILLAEEAAAIEGNAGDQS